MATTTYLEDLTLASRNELFTLLSDALVAKGWTRTVINSDTAAPSFNENVRREEVFQSPGDGVDTGGFFIGMRVYIDANGTRVSILLFGFTATGPGGFVAITSLSRTGTTVTCTTAVPHQMNTGDIVHINGSDNPTLNEMLNGAATTHSTITVTGASTFTYTSNTSGNATANGGTCYAMFNLAGPVTGGINDSPRLNIDDAANDIVGGVNEIAIAGNVMQGGQWMFFYLGSTGRGHIPATLSQTLTASGSITGSGGVQTVAVDETPSDLIVGQPVDIIDSETDRIYRTTIAAIGASSVDMNIAVGQDFAAGSKIGWDPMPVSVCGIKSTVQATQPIDAYVFNSSYGINGTRPWAQTDPDDPDSQYTVMEPRVTNAEEGVQDTADVNLGAIATYDVVMTKNSGTAGLFGTRGPLQNMIGCIVASQNDFDYAKTGKTSPDDDYKMFTSQQVTSATDNVAYGPNAPGAPAL